MFSEVSTPDLADMLEGPEGRKFNIRNRLMWAELYRRFPDRHGIALNFAIQLWSAEAIDLLARLLPGLVKQFPRSQPLHTLWVEMALTWGEPEEAERRLVLMQSHIEPDSRMLLYACQVYLATGNFLAAAKMAAKGRKMHGDALFDFMLSLAQRYEELGSQWAVQSASRDYHIYCVGLDRQPRRFRRVHAQLQRMGETVQPVSGVDGGTLPEMAARVLTHGSSGRMKGTLGCFLSHVRVWELCACGDMPYAFIIEDDTRFVLPPPPGVSSLVTGGEDFDLCFVNEGPQNVVYMPEKLPLDQPAPLERVLATREETFRGIGTYGYFVSREAARKLLDMVAQDGMVGDVDWRLLLYSVSDAALVDEQNAFMAQSFKLHRTHRKSSGQLKALIAPPAIVKTYNGGSVRSVMNDFSHAYEEFV